MVNVRLAGLLFCALGCNSRVTTFAPSDGGALPNDAPSVDEGGSESGLPPTSTLPPTGSVLEHHASQGRVGLYVVPTLTRAAAFGAHPDPTLQVTFDGGVYSQPLYVEDGPNGSGAYYVVTETNLVIAISAIDGHTIWQKSLGIPANRESIACPSFNPFGVTSTPIIDRATRMIYVAAVSSKPLNWISDPTLRGVDTWLVHALSVDDGTERAGWPIDLNGVVSNGHSFKPSVQLQRGALALAEDTLYVPFGSAGDCGDYHGWIIGIPLSHPRDLWGWSTVGPQGGIWAPSGVAGDGSNVFFATGNGGQSGGGSLDSDSGTPVWTGGEAVFRATAGSSFSNTKSAEDYYAVDDWFALDQADQDLGGSGVVIFNVAHSSPSELAAALGKDGYLYLLDAHHLGNALGAPTLATLQVATGSIVDSAAVVTNDDGAMLVFDTQNWDQGVGCPRGQAGDLVGVQILAGSPPTAQVAWCVQNNGHGSPIITTTDGVKEPIVWITADTSGALRGYNAVDGNVIFAGDPSLMMTGLHRFNTLIAAGGRLVFAGDNRLYAFTY